MMEDPLDLTLEGISSRNRKKGEQMKFTSSGRSVRQSTQGRSSVKPRLSSGTFESSRSNLKVKDSAIKQILVSSIESCNNFK